MLEEIMTIKNCAKYLKTSVSTIYRLAQEGKIPASKVGNQWRFKKRKIDEWLDSGGIKLEGEKRKEKKLHMRIQKNGTLYVVGTDIGNPSDITLRALDILRSVDLIIGDDEAGKKCPNSRPRILRLHKIPTKFIPYQGNEIEYYLQFLKVGKSIAVVTFGEGTPMIYDLGLELVKEAIREKIKVVSVPGAAAIVSALVVSGFSLDTFVFDSLLCNEAKKRERLSILSKEPRTVVFFDGISCLKETLHDILKFFGNREIALCFDLTKSTEKVIRGTIREVAEKLSGNLKFRDLTIVIAPPPTSQHK